MSPRKSRAVVSRVEYFVRDVAGRPVRVRDVAGGTTAGPLRATVFGAVVQLGNAKVLIRCGGTSAIGPRRPAIGDHQWVRIDRIFLVRARGDTPDADAQDSLTGSVDDYVRGVFGQPIRVGDTVIYWWSSYDRLPVFGVVVRLSASSVTVVRVAETGGGQGDEETIPLERVLLVPPPDDQRPPPF